jgi:predicted nucleic-acid-binding Zn-ribbon protein
MELTSNCPKCKGQLEQGFVVDHAHYGAPMVSEWMAGPPKTSWMGVKVKGVRQITTYRCTGCGYLESYAK